MSQAGDPSLSAAANAPPSPAAKLRAVLDYLPCDACLAEPSPEQDLLCSVCKRLDRSITAKRVERRAFIVVKPAPPPPPTLIEPAPLEAEAAPERTLIPEPGPSEPLAEPEPVPLEAEAETVPIAPEPEPVPLEAEPEVPLEATEIVEPEPVAPPALPRVLVLDATTADDAPRADPGTIEILIEDVLPPEEAPSAVATLDAPAEAEFTPEVLAEPEETFLEAEVAPAEEAPLDASPAEATAEEEEEFDAGFDLVGDGPPEDAFAVAGGEALRARASDLPVAEPAVEEEGAAEALPDFDESDFVFTPPPREPEPAPADVEELPLEAEAEPALFEAEPEPLEAEPPARPVEDDWLLEAAPEPAAPVEEPWPEEPTPAEAPAAVEPALPEPAPAEPLAPEPLPAEPTPSAPSLGDAGDDDILETTPVPDAGADEEIVEASVVADDEPVTAAPADLRAAGLRDLKAFDAERLADAGVRGLPDLTGRDPWALADRTGLSGKKIEKWIWTAELIQVAGVPADLADVLVRSGVHGLPGLRSGSAEAIAKHANTLIALEQGVGPAVPHVMVEHVVGWKKKA